MIEKYLEDLERRIDGDVEDTLLAQWKSFAGGGFSEGVFSPRRSAPKPPGLAWPHVLVNEALDDLEKMALQQLEPCSQALAEGSGALLAVRCNYGTAILPSLFGAELFRMGEDLDTLPTCRPLAGGADAVKRLVDRGVPDLNTGLGGKVFQMGEYYRQLFAAYPKLERYAHIYHPDLQGPMNVCEMLWGGSLYVDFYDKPDLIKEFLSLITETYIRFMRRWDEIVAPLDGWAVHWSMLHKGHVMIRDDAATNFSPEMFEEFVRPYDQRLLDAFGGGGIHFCGRGDHFIATVAEMSGVYTVNMTQPDLNDTEIIFRSTIDKGITLIGLEAEAATQTLGQGRNLRGRAHCWDGG
ncbi:MAG: hypothetical protein JW741_25705 [Sedimentisphaerales bacterium]|nr:hypothetical protein [Sedimentisphaerales bacterium]